METRRNDLSQPFAPGEGAKIAKEEDAKIKAWFGAGCPSESRSNQIIDSKVEVMPHPTFQQLLESARDWERFSTQKTYIEAQTLTPYYPISFENRQRLAEIRASLSQLNQLFPQESGLIAESLSPEVLSGYFYGGTLLKEKSLLGRLPIMRQLLTRCQLAEMRLKLADTISGRRLNSHVATSREIEQAGELAAGLLLQEDERRSQRVPKILPK